MSVLKSLAFNIEVNRQRLHYAIETGNQDLVQRMVALLAQLQAQFFDQAKKEVNMSKRQTQKLYLVFSDANLDGALMTLTEYRALCRKMSRSDRETHVAVEVDAEMQEATEQALLLDAAEARKRAG